MRRRLMGGLDLFLALLLLAGVWIALPVRWWPMDVGMTLVALLLGVAGFGLYRGAAWGERVGKAVAVFTLVVGCGLATTLAFTAAGLVGLYGPVGQGGAIILTVSAFLVLPYLVVFPAAQLYFLLPSSTKADAESREPKADAESREPKADSERREPKADSDSREPKADSDSREPKADSDSREPKADSDSRESKAEAEAEADAEEKP
ncbi:MAG: hypothetical protein JJ863_12390 [Deltaproteobacteria bacterium]|nr:hypothetical protein [Deltaproteobacteria bacterium]